MQWAFQRELDLFKRSKVPPTAVVENDSKLRGRIWEGWRKIGSTYSEVKIFDFRFGRFRYSKPVPRRQSNRIVLIHLPTNHHVQQTYRDHNLTQEQYLIYGMSLTV